MSETTPTVIMESGLKQNGSSRNSRRRRRPNSKKKNEETRTNPESMELPVGNPKPNPRKKRGNARAKSSEPALDNTLSGETTTNSSNKLRPKQKSKPKAKSKSKSKFKQKERDPIKLIIRQLPPNLTEEGFLSTIKEKLGPKFFILFSIESWYFVPGHYSSRPFKRPVNSRAYFHFPQEKLAQLNSFVQKLIGINFVDNKYNVIVLQPSMLRRSVYAVSYTHLDVYKRQVLNIAF